MSKTIGSVSTMTLNLTDPIKMTIEKMSFNQLCILVGQNGTGKTLVLKINWCMAMISNTIIGAKLMNIPSDNIKNAQYIFDKSFDDQNFNGTIEVHYENATLSITFDSGIVKNVNMEHDEDITPNAPPIFMSKETRTFDSYIHYMKLKKVFKIEGEMIKMSEEQIEKLLVMYKLYDILFMEMMLNKLENYSVPQTLVDHFKELGITKPIDQIVIDNDICDISVISEGTKINIVTFGAGEQSMINMMLAAS